MAISLTDNASSRIRHYMANHADAVGLRLGVKKTGCNGFSYVLDYAHEIGANDTVFEDNGVKVIVEPDSLELVDGTQVDFVKEGLNEMFRFKNPNASGECGCGESFNI